MSSLKLKKLQDLCQRSTNKVKTKSLNDDTIEEMVKVNDSNLEVIEEIRKSLDSIKEDSYKDKLLTSFTVARKKNVRVLLIHVQILRFHKKNLMKGVFLGETP
ncbi:hypothetical protein SESBI_02567 [Sesbania bispinosa]|nr:hypothetical protein SESBI_02567 [Sesbania bispinosa]